jgi:hypothetical protein
MEGDQSNQFLQPFYRLFVYSPDQVGGSHWEIHASPDREQPGSASEPVAIIRCEDLDQLASSLHALGAEGRSRFAREGVTGPVFDYAPCSIDSVIASLRSHPPSSNRSITLVAPRISIREMQGRIAVVLGERQETASR